MHIVKYTERERGWGGEVWFVGRDTKAEAEQLVYENNKPLPRKVPDYYILASYVGEANVVPEGCKL